MNKTLEKYSHDVNHTSSVVINEMIKRKNNDMPHYVNPKMICSIVTDMDHFPYHRFYRGRYYSDRPTVIAREAGYRQLRNVCYQAGATPIPGLPKDMITFSDID